MNKILTDKQFEQYIQISKKRDELIEILEPFSTNLDAIVNALQPGNLEKMGANPHTLSKNIPTAFVKMLQNAEKQFYEINEQYKYFMYVKNSYDTEINVARKDDWSAAELQTQQKIAEITQKYKQRMEQIEAQEKTIDAFYHEKSENQPSISSMFK